MLPCMLRAGPRPLPAQLYDQCQIMFCTSTCGILGEHLTFQSGRTRCQPCAGRIPAEYESACAAQVSPEVQAQHAEALDRAIAGLKYGSINVNVATMLGFCVPKLTWGAYPGNPPQVLLPSCSPCWHLLSMHAQPLLFPNLREAP